MTKLSVKNLSVHLSPEIKIRADFNLLEGERLALVGRSGSGKSSVLKMIAGILTPDEGELLLNEKNLLPLPMEKRKIGFVFQRPALFPTLNVSENLSFGLRMQGLAKNERDEISKVWLKKLGLLEKENEPVHFLSGGEAQRLSLGRSLISSPDLLLLDEPFSALDPSLKNSLRGLILDLHKERPIPLILVTHDETDVEALATHVIHVKEKGIVRSFEINS